MTCTIKSHRLIHPSLPKPAAALARKPTAVGGIAWPSFTGTATLVGTSTDGRTTVYYDASLGAQALANAKALLADAPRVNALDNGFFGTSGPVNVILFALGGATDGTGGADHASCDYMTGGNIEVCVAYGQDARCIALYEAELSECDMGGNLCGNSVGEALSRLCAEYGIGPNALSDFASAPAWAQAGYPNWVDQTEGTDGDYNSIGCGLAFLSWLRSQGYSIAKIAQTIVSLGDSGTLAQLWNKLTGESGSPWTAFLAAAKAISITSDDPFAGSTPTPPPPPGPPPPTPTPTGPTLTAAQQTATGAVNSYAKRFPRFFQQYITGCEPYIDAALAALWAPPGVIAKAAPAAAAAPPWLTLLEQLIAQYGLPLAEQILADILAGKFPLPTPSKP